MPTTSPPARAPTAVRPVPPPREFAAPPAPAATAAAAERIDWRGLAPWIVTGLAFLVLFWNPMTTVARAWWTEPDAGQGLLLAPIALYAAWKRGIVASPRAQRRLGMAMLVAAVLVRYLSGLAAELFTMRMSMLLAFFGLAVFIWGARQLVHWWLPVLLLVLAIPLPQVILNSLAIPLQFKASQMGAALLAWRHVPVLLTGNVIHLPGQTLFVTEACSGLRSLSALIALGVLIGGLWLRSPIGRVLLVAAAIPVAVVLNGIRVFLTGFLVYFVDPRLGQGFMHLTEGWLIFIVAFAILGGAAWVVGRLERVWSGRRAAA